jgi:hypothetical protein
LRTLPEGEARDERGAGRRQAEAFDEPPDLQEMVKLDILGADRRAN